MAKTKTRTKKQLVEDYVKPQEVSEEVHIKQKKLVGTSKLKTIKLTERQKILIQLIDDNTITAIWGPAGCLTKNSKILIYSMKSKNKKHTIIDERQTTDT